MMELILLLQADSDLQGAYNQYEEIQTGRGDVFLRQLDFALELIRRNPELGPVYAGRYRRILIRRFPFGVFYDVQPRRIIVAAVMNLQQDPENIRRRLGVK